MPDRLADLGKFRRTPGWLPRGPWDWGTNEADRPYFNRNSPEAFLENLGYGHIHEESEYMSNATADVSWKEVREKLRRRWHDLKARVLIYFNHVRDSLEGNPEREGGISTERLEELLDGAWEDMKKAVKGLEAAGKMPRKRKYGIQPDPFKPV